MAEVNTLNGYESAEEQLAIARQVAARHFVGLDQEARWELLRGQFREYEHTVRLLHETALVLTGGLLELVVLSDTPPTDAAQLLSAGLSGSIAIMDARRLEVALALPFGTLYETSGG